MQPPGYSRQADFSQDESDNVSGRSTVRTAALDAELDAVQTSVNATISNLGLIQRDDGHIRDQAVDVYNLTTAVLALMGSAGFTVANPIGWLTATAYPARQIVVNGTGTYVSAVAHTSGVFATDLAAGKWALLFNSAAFAAAAVSFTPTGTIIATTVQAAIAEAALEAMQKSANLSDVASIPAARSNLAVPSKVEMQGQTPAFCQAAGTFDVMTGAFTPAVTSLTGPLILFVESVGANATTTPNFQADATAVQTIVKGSNQALVAGDIPGANYLMILYNDVSLGKYVLLNPSYAVSVPAAAAQIIPVTVRQTVMQGPLSAGQPSMMSAGVGLNGNLSATAIAVRLAFAAGILASGNVDYVESLTADVASYWALLAANNTTYAYITRASAGNVAAGQTLAPPQRGYTYDQSAQGVLQMAGLASSTVFLDDYGNTWAAQGGAKIATDQIKFGTGSLGGAGALNVLNGTTDFIKSTSFTSLGENGWALRAWVRPTSVAALGNVFSAFNGSNFGAQLGISTAGKLLVSLSSNGTSFDIAAATVGTAVMTVNNWYFLELTFDALAGVYRTYINGVADVTVSSAAKVCAITSITVGSNPAGSAGIVGYIGAGFEFLPYCQHPAGTAYAVPTGLPNITAAGYSSDWYDKSATTMRAVSSASVAAASNPLFGTTNRIYTGEFDTSGAAVTATRTYAYNKKYESAWTNTLPSATTQINFNHNLGEKPRIMQLEIECITADSASGYVKGERLPNAQPYNSTSTTYTGPTMNATRNTGTWATNNNLSIGNKATNAQIFPTLANYRYRFIALGDGANI